ncbi:MAG: type II secretion system protein [Candidatus Melainabacteria bacterium]
MGGRNGKHRQAGFTLAELLIALAIMGVIITMVIPKVLTAQGNRYSAVGSEMAATVSGAVNVYRRESALGADTTMADLAQYMNYVTVDATSIIDDIEGNTSLDCSAATCLRFVNDGVLYFDPTVSFGGTETTNALWMVVDPDGRYCGSTNCAGKSMEYFVYYNSRVTTLQNITPGTVSSDATRNPVANADPAWSPWRY